MYGIIYKITNKVNGKIYIGLTKQKLSDRFRGHWSDAHKSLRGKGRICYFQQALLKYGKDNFIKEKIDEAETKEELEIREKYWISYYNSTDREIGYNVSEGGEGGDTCSEFVWITDGKENRYVFYKDEIPLGFRRGRTICEKFANSNKGKIYIHNDEECILIPEDEIEKYIKSGWQRGMLDRGDAWRDNIRASMKNLSEDARKKRGMNFKRYYQENPHATNSTSFKKGMKTHNKGKISVTNGTTNKYIEEEMLEDFLYNNADWYRGNTQHHKRKEKDING